MALMPLGVLFILTVVFGPFVICWYLALRLLAKRMVLPVGMTTMEVKSWCAAIAVITTMLACGQFVANAGPGLFLLNAGMIIGVAIASVVTSLLNARRGPDKERAKLSSLFWYVLVVGILGIGGGYAAELLLNGLFVDD